MSEYQAYYFARVDRPLSGKEIEAVDALSSHMEVGAHSAFVHYHYGDFKHKPLHILKKWFDVFVYYANWGSQTIGFRFNKDAIDVERLVPFEVDEVLMVETSEDHVVVLAQFDENYGDGAYYDLSEERGGFYAGYVSLYNAILRGDDRALFLLWLKAMEKGGDSDDRAPIPGGLHALDAELTQLTEFIDLDSKRVEAAAQRNPAPAAKLSSAPQVEYTKYLDRLTQDQSTHYLEQLLTEDPHIVRANLIRELRQYIPKPARPSDGVPLPTITFGEVEQFANQLHETHMRKEAEKRTAQRRAYFKRLDREADRMWKKARELIERKQTKAYEQAMEILYTLKCLATEQDDEARFFKHTEELVAAYPRQRSLPGRMHAAGVLADDDSAKSIKFAIKQNRWNESHPADTFFDFDLLDA
jgi:hypothetical protein